MTPFIPFLLHKDEVAYQKSVRYINEEDLGVEEGDLLFTGAVAEFSSSMKGALAALRRILELDNCGAEIQRRAISILILLDHESRGKLSNRYIELISRLRSCLKSRINVRGGES